MTCPCKSGKDFSECCEPFVTGKKKPLIAEELLRSRYTAFTQVNMNYIVETHHPETRDSVDVEGNKQWAEAAEWRGLEVARVTGGGAQDQSAEIAFVANFDIKGEQHSHRELSDFRKKDGTWYFYDGKDWPRETFVRTEAKVGRNDPCPCGSGKKYKKCCGVNA